MLGDRRSEIPDALGIEAIEHGDGTAQRDRQPLEAADGMAIDEVVYVDKGRGLAHSVHSLPMAAPSHDGLSRVDAHAATALTGNMNELK